MRTVFSHVVRMRLSQEYENVATDALAFILQSSEPARSGMMKLLRGSVPELPDLWFRTQQSEGSARPDMWGLDETASAHVFVENKFWAGLTDNQPVSYLRKLAAHSRSGLLLVVAPAARERAVWRELTARLQEAGISAETLPSSHGSTLVARTGVGPTMGLATWTTLLAFLEAETAEDLAARNDIGQLRALCDEADSGAFVPFTRVEMSNQETPSHVLQLTGLVQDVAAVAFEEGALFRDRTSVQGHAERVGRYAHILAEERCGVWLGIHFRLWKEYGRSPFWIVFSTSDWGRAYEVRALLEPWAARTEVLVATQADGQFAVAIDIPCGVERPSVVRGVVDRLAEIGRALAPLPPRKSKGVPELNEE